MTEHGGQICTTHAVGPASASCRPLFTLYLRARLTGLFTCSVSFFATVSHLSAKIQFSPNHGPRPEAKSNVACSSFLPLPHLRHVTLHADDICCAPWVRDVQAEVHGGLFARRSIVRIDVIANGTLPKTLYDRRGWKITIKT